jgi:glycosyltransferase involved in cell wall biosynthesis
MRIAMLAPPFVRVPPQAYGGTERIVSYITEGLVGRGHDVTLFASGDSVTKAKLVSIYPEALGLDGTKKDDVYRPLLHISKCFEHQKEFDLIHAHTQYLGLFMASLSTTPVVHTWHGTYFPGEVPEINRQVLSTFKSQNYISISNSQRGGMPELNYIDTIYNGIDISQYSEKENSQKDYLLWVGRATPKKGPLEAIMVAKKLGIKLIMAASVEPANQEYFETVIKPEIDGTKIVFVGDVDAKALNDLYGNALCTLYPISWHEPFGLVMAESMACGTPVIAYNVGSVSEIVRDGITGFIVNEGPVMGAFRGSLQSVREMNLDFSIKDSSLRSADSPQNPSPMPPLYSWIIKKTGLEGLIEAVSRIGEIDRASCRKQVAEYFTIDKMVIGYENAYQKVLGNK